MVDIIVYFVFISSFLFLNCCHIELACRISTFSYEPHFIMLISRYKYRLGLSIPIKESFQKMGKLLHGEKKHHTPCFISLMRGIKSGF